MKELKTIEKQILDFCKQARQMEQIQHNFWIKYGKAYTILRDLQAFGLIRKTRTLSNLKIYKTTDEGLKLISGGFENNL